MTLLAKFVRCGCLGLLALAGISVAVQPGHAASCDGPQCLPAVDIGYLVDPGVSGPVLDYRPASRSTGLCASFKATANPSAVFAPRSADFPGSPPDYAAAQEFPESVNAFMDGLRGSGSDGPRVDVAMPDAPYDLSNDLTVADSSSVGDYANTAGCALMSGCSFPGDLTASQTSAFAARYRGYIYVSSSWLSRPVHFGFVVDDAVAMVIYGRSYPPYAASATSKPHLVLSRGGSPGNSGYRVTNSVKFHHEGVYPVEILYAQLAANTPAFLEMAVLSDEPNFTDIDEPVMVGRASLSQDVSGQGQGKDRRRFTLLDKAPFFKTLYDANAAPPPSCKQCPRMYARPSTLPLPAGICDPGEFCNAAGLCERACPYAGDGPCSQDCVLCNGDPRRSYCVRRDPSRPEDSFCGCQSDGDCGTFYACWGGSCGGPRPPDYRSSRPSPDTAASGCSCQSTAAPLPLRGSPWLAGLLLLLIADRRRRCRRAKTMHLAARQPARCS